MRNTTKLYPLGSRCCHRLGVCWVSPTRGQTTFGSFTSGWLVVKFRAKYSDILTSDSKAWCSGPAQRVKNWGKAVQAHRYQIKDNKNSFPCFFSSFSFFLILFLAFFFLLSDLLYWFSMMHRSDWLKNFTEMALDIKPRSLSLSLWAQFCTPSCLFLSSYSFLSELSKQHVLL